MDDSPRRDDLRELLERLSALEHRLAALEKWVAMPARPPPAPPPPAPPPVPVKPIEPPPIVQRASPPPLPVQSLDVARVSPLPPPRRRESFDLEAWIGQN